MFSLRKHMSSLRKHMFSLRKHRFVEKTYVSEKTYGFSQRTYVFSQKTQVFQKTYVFLGKYRFPPVFLEKLCFPGKTQVFLENIGSRKQGKSKNSEPKYTPLHSLVDNHPVLMRDSFNFQPHLFHFLFVFPGCQKKSFEPSTLNFCYQRLFSD